MIVNRHRRFILPTPALACGLLALDPHASHGRGCGKTGEKKCTRSRSPPRRSSPSTGAPPAQEWPTRPITMVIPFAPGGGIDASGRIQAQRMGELLGQTIVVDNHGAAAGTVGSPARRQGARPTATRSDGQFRHPRLQPGPAQAAGLQLRHRLHADRPGYRIAAHPAGAQGPAGEQPAGVRRLCEGQPGEDAVRLGRRRLRHASAVRAPQHARSASRSRTCPTRAPAR